MANGLLKDNMDLKRWLVPFTGRSKTFLALLAHGYFTKAQNYLLTNLNMIRRPQYAANYPTTIVIDTGNICNLSCALCITGQKKSPRPGKLLSFSDFKKIIDQLGKRAVQLDLYNWGEPLLNQDIFAMIAYAKKWGLRVETSSNLLLLTPKMAEEMVSSGLDRLILSLHGATPKTTQIYMRNGNFRQAIANLKLLLKTKKKRQSKTPSITWRYVVSAYNEAELGLAQKKALGLGVDYFEPVPLKLDVGFDPEAIVRNIRKNAHWLPKNKKYLLYDSQAGKPINNPLDCFWPWEITAVNSNGTIQPCCVFSSPRFDLGNMLKTPFQEIWNGAKYQTSRRVIREKIKNDRATLCGSCVAHDFIGK